MRATDDREKVAKRWPSYDLLAMPVVDDQGRLVGIVTHDDVIDVVVQEATEDVHRMGAVGPMAENYLKADFVTVWRKRAFWLACLFVAELFTFTALAHFEDAIDKVVVLAPVRAAVHLDGRQLRLAGGDADHAGHGAGASHVAPTGSTCCATSCSWASCWA